MAPEDSRYHSRVNLNLNPVLDQSAYLRLRHRVAGLVPPIQPSINIDLDRVLEIFLARFCDVRHVSYVVRGWPAKVLSAVSLPA